MSSSVRYGAGVHPKSCTSLTFVKCVSGCLAIDCLPDAAGQIGQKVRVVGIRQTSRRSRTGKGETMLFLALEDLDGVLDVIVYPDVYQRAKQVLLSNPPMVITGRMKLERDREPYLKAEKAELIAETEA
jgi:DNA polymerase III alpha subunit